MSKPACYVQTCSVNRKGHIGDPDYDEVGYTISVIARREWDFDFAAAKAMAQAIIDGQYEAAIPLADLVTEAVTRMLAPPEPVSELGRVQRELATGDFSCPQLFESCGETFQRLSDMAELGCEKCQQWAVLKIREEELLKEPR